MRCALYPGWISPYFRIKEQHSGLINTENLSNRCAIFATVSSGNSSGVEHQLPKLRAVGSIPISRSVRDREKTSGLFSTIYFLKCYQKQKRELH